MLHRRDDHLISGADEFAAVAVHDEINPLSRASDKDALF